MVTSYLSEQGTFSADFRDLVGDVALHYYSLTTASKLKAIRLKGKTMNWSMREPLFVFTFLARRGRNVHICFAFPTVPFSTRLDPIFVLSPWRTKQLFRENVRSCLTEGEFCNCLCCANSRRA